MTDKAPYRWKIDKDYLDGGTDSSAVGIEGPHNLDETLDSNPRGFTLYDDDDNAYYHGWIYGDYEGFEPVDDFGLGYAGAPHIKLDGDDSYL
jgi:hypothetical protein